MTRPNILFLAHRVPYPPNRGDRIRSFHLLRFLAARADISLAFLSDGPVATETMAVLDGMCQRVSAVPWDRRARWLRAARSFLAGRTATEGLFWAPALGRTVRQWTESTQFDVAFAFCSSMVQYLNAPGLDGVPKVVDLVDVDSQKWFDYAGHTRGPRRRLLQLEGRRLRQLEASLPDRVAAVTLVSPQEVELFRSFCPSDRVFAIRNGVDLDYFRPQESEVRSRRSDVGCRRSEVGSRRSEVRSQRSEVRGQRSEVRGQSSVDCPSPPMSDLRLPISDLRPPISAPCLFVGALDYDANVDGVSWFCREIWPRVRQSHPDAEFRLVGSRPGPAAQRLGRLPGVNLVGEVPDVRPHLREAALVVVPLRVARGIQNKVLEALAMGKAVVATPPALEGIGLEPDVHARQAATADQWVRIVGELLSDPAQCIRLGVAGRKFVETQFHWEVRLQPLASIPVLRGCWASGPPDGSSCSHDDRDPGSSPAPV